jgi:hypothetical protein
MMGKGSSPRPYSVPKTKFDEQFDLIFGKKQNESKQSNEGTGSNDQRRSESSKESSLQSTGEA